MKNLLLILTLFLTVVAQAQSPGDVPPPPPPTEPGTIKDAQIYTAVDQLPEFPGGEDALLKYLGKNIKYPVNARDCGCQGTVFATFVIAEDGSVTNPIILRGVNCGKGIKYYDRKGNELPESQKDKAVSILDFAAVAKEVADETLRVIMLMPKWKPGSQDGKPVKVQYNLPVKFTLR